MTVKGWSGVYAGFREFFPFQRRRLLWKTVIPFAHEGELDASAKTGAEAKFTQDDFQTTTIANRAVRVDPAAHLPRLRLEDIMPAGIPGSRRDE
jgi:hypothetical protein